MTFDEAHTLVSLGDSDRKAMFSLLEECLDKNDEWEAVSLGVALNVVLLTDLPEYSGVIERFCQCAEKSIDQLGMKEQLRLNLLSSGTKKV